MFKWWLYASQYFMQLSLFFLCFSYIHFFIWYKNQTGNKLVISIYGKSYFTDPSSSTCSTHVTTWLAGQLRCHYHALMTPGWRKSNKTTDVIMQWFKESTYPRQVLIRSYVSTPRENLLYMNGNGPLNTPVLRNFLETSFSSPSFPKWHSRAARPEYIPRSSRCFEAFMNFYMEFFSKTEKVSKIYVKS